MNQTTRTQPPRRGRHPGSPRGNTISKTMMTRIRATTTTITRTCAARRDTITNESIALTIRIQKITRTAMTASVETSKAPHHNIDDGRRNCDRFRDNYGDRHTRGRDREFCKAVTKRCPAQKHRALIAPLGHPLLVLTKLWTPTVGVLDIR